MDITTILNRRASAVVDAQFHFLPSQISASPKMKSEAGAPNSGDHSLSYPSQPPLGQMNAYPQQSNMPMMQNAYVPGYQNTQIPDGVHASNDQAAKNFACSTCGKGFARRSDLARHGRPVSFKQ